MIAHASPLLSLLRLSSPALPIGAFAYSRGLEHAVHAGWVHDEASACAWIVGTVQHATTRLDAPCLLRGYDAWLREDLAAVEHVNALLHASRESAELLLEDVQLASALARLLASLDVPHARGWLGRDDGCHVTLFALAATHFQIGREAALLGYLWTIVEAQTGAAVRLVPLGQTAGQRILSRAIEALPACAATAHQLAGAPDDALGALTPALSIGSALHETQYTRLFRS